MNKLMIEATEISPKILFDPASKVFDVREYGTSNYDLLIIGPNEEMPPIDRAFIKSGFININGLEYWEIYAKERN